MTGGKTAIINRVHPELLEPPHAIGMLIDVMNGERKSNLFQQEDMVAHIVACEHCRTAIILVLSAGQENEQFNDHPDSSVHDLLTRFVDIHHEIKAREYELMAAYAETIVADGESEASRRFPALAEHVKTCPRCTYLLKETVASLNVSSEDN